MDTIPQVLNELIKNRRSVFPKQFVPGKEIPGNIINQILENATWAPSHGKTEPWHFVVFSGKGLEKLANFQSELYKQEAGSRFTEAKYKNLQSQPLLASHVIALCMKATNRFPEMEEIAAVSCAIQNIYLTVTAYGLGGYWSTGGVTYSENAKPFFGLGPTDKLLGFFALGYVAVPSPPITRKPLEEKVVWVNE